MVLLKEYQYTANFRNCTRKRICLLKMTTFTSKAYKHANRTIDDVKVPTKCVLRKRLMMRKLRAKQRQQTNRDLTPLGPGKRVVDSTLSF